MPFYILNDIRWDMNDIKIIEKNEKGTLPISIGISVDINDEIYNEIYRRIGYKIISASISKL